MGFGGFASLMNQIIRGNRELLRKRKFLRSDELKGFEKKKEIRKVEIDQQQLKRIRQKMIHHNRVIRFWRRVVMLSLSILIVVLLVYLIKG